MLDDDDDDCPWQCGGTSADKRQSHRVFHMPKMAVTLSVAQDGGSIASTELWSRGAGAVVWEAAEATVRYLDASFAPDRLRGQRVLELGAGTGVCGLACAAMGATVVVAPFPRPFATRPPPRPAPRVAMSLDRLPRISREVHAHHIQPRILGLANPSARPIRRGVCLETGDGKTA